MPQKYLLEVKELCFTRKPQIMYMYKTSQMLKKNADKQIHHLSVNFFIQGTLKI